MWFTLFSNCWSYDWSWFTYCHSWSQCSKQNLHIGAACTGGYQYMSEILPNSNIYIYVLSIVSSWATFCAIKQKLRVSQLILTTSHNIFTVCLYSKSSMFLWEVPTSCSTPTLCLLQRNWNENTKTFLKKCKCHLQYLGLNVLMIMAR